MGLDLYQLSTRLTFFIPQWKTQVCWLWKVNCTGYAWTSIRLFFARQKCCYCCFFQAMANTETKTYLEQNNLELACPELDSIRKEKCIPDMTIAVSL